MTPALFLSRARLRRDASSAALAEIFQPEELDKRVSVAHKLLWTLFSDRPDRRRDFLWREANPGAFYLLSQREPQNTHGLFEIDPPKPFAPALKPGDRLVFSLRANPTVACKNGSERGKRSDIVMNTIKSVPKGERAEPRQIAIHEAGEAWMRRQGERRGFSIEAVRVDRYQIMRPPHGRQKMQIATLDFDGVLRVADNATFVAALAQGFGRAKAYGCGLMLIRRA